MVPHSSRCALMGERCWNAGTEWLIPPSWARWLPDDSHSSCPSRWVSRAGEVLARRQFLCTGAREHVGGCDTWASGERPAETTVHPVKRLGAAQRGLGGSRMAEQVGPLDPPWLRGQLWEA